MISESNLIASYKRLFVPLCNGGKMEPVTLKVDSKGRICIPSEIREEIGQTATLKKISGGYMLIPGKQTDFLEEFRRKIASEPRRKGKPKLVSPEEMKSIWKTKT